jgi:hypothetical protein
MPNNFVPRSRSRHRRPARQPASARDVAAQVPRLLSEIAIACELPRGDVRQLWSAIVRAGDPMTAGFRLDLVLQSRRERSLTDFLLHQGSPQRVLLVLEHLVVEGLLTRGVASHVQERLLALVDARGAWLTVPLSAERTV